MDYCTKRGSVVSVKDELQDIFRDVFDDEELDLSEETTAKDIEDWDSFAQIQLIIAIEKHFNVHFQVHEVSALKNVGEMIRLIEESKKN